MVRILPQSDENLIAVEVSGQVKDNEYKVFEKKLEDVASKYGRIRLYADARNLEGATISTMWDDLKNLPYYQIVDRFAVVGTKTWEKMMVKATSLFVGGQLKYFEDGQQDQALQWVKEVE